MDVDTTLNKELNVKKCLAKSNEKFKASCRFFLHLNDAKKMPIPYFTEKSSIHRFLISCEIAGEADKTASELADSWRNEKSFLLFF